MANIGVQASKDVRLRVLGKCWQYLLVNFDKFSADKKLKIIMTLCAKDMPTQIEGQLDIGTLLGAIHNTVSKAGNG